MNVIDYLTSKYKALTNSQKINIVAVAVIAVIVVSFLTGCGQQDVSFSTLETARTQAKANAEYNAQKFRADSATFSNYVIEMQGDSTQAPACPQGDGWASGKLIDKANPASRVAIKCSTVSGAVGCMLQSEFEKKPYASDDGHCQPTSKVPHPIPKIAS